MKATNPPGVAPVLLIRYAAYMNTAATAAAEHLHQRCRAIAHARHLIGSDLDLIDAEVHLAPTLVLEPEGLDDPHPLQRLLQHQKDARAALHTGRSPVPGRAW